MFASLTLLLATGTLAAPGNSALLAASNNSTAITAAARIPVMRMQEAASSGEIMKMIDLRDLAAAMSLSTRARGSHLSDIPLLSHFVSGSDLNPFVQHEPAPPAAPSDPLFDLVDRLCDSLGIHVTIYNSGLLVVTGEAEPISKLEKLLDQAWDVHVGRYDVELVIVSFPNEQVPAIGAPLAGGHPVARTRRTVVARTSTDISSTDTIHYVGGWDPIVADSAVGYKPLVSSASSGLVCELTVSPGHHQSSDQATHTITITGSLRRANVVPRTIDVSAPGGTSSLTIGEAIVQSRSVSMAGDVGGGLTVLAWVPGFEEGRTIVIAASARLTGARR